MTAEDMIKAAMAIREANGLHIVVETNDGPFNMYAKDEAQRERWLASAKRQNLPAEVV